MKRFIIVKIVFIYLTCLCFGGKAFFQGYPLVLDVRNESGEIQFDVLLDQGDLEKKEMEKLLTAEEENTRWIFMCRYTKSLDGQIARDSYEVLPVRKGEFSLFCDLPGGTYARYYVDLVRFRRFLKGEIEWVWEPVIKKYKIVKD